MFVIGFFDTSDAVAMLRDDPATSGLVPNRWEAYCQKSGLFALSAEEDGKVAAFAVAESHPRVLHVLNLEGNTGACELLLDRLGMIAGERDVSGWFACDNPVILKMLERRGYVRKIEDDHRGRPAYLYHWSRNPPAPS